MFISDNIVYAGTSGQGVWSRSLNEIIGIRNISSDIPEGYKLYQNYPNPFNPNTIIKFNVPSNVKSQTSDVKLYIYDITGREIETLVNEQLLPGTYEVTFVGSNLPSGIYFYQLRAGNYFESKKMLLIK
jgi:hypothetical protein